MQVILMDDVERVGHEGDVIEVADGFARNFLLPKKLAVAATKGALKDLESRRKAIEGREAQKATKAQAIADDLASKRVVVKARAGEGQRIHGQVTPAMIAEAAAEQIGAEIDRRDIDIAEPIRELGDYLISVRVYKTVAAQLPVSVVREKSDEDEKEAVVAAEVAEEETPAEDEATDEATDEPQDADVEEAPEE
ncbi:MAG: 50S ribosomal protein L9 [Armatimonadetes bacterium]|jgi:large subunit ribosomal protein L9|nr:50S ribosomal protein L9 [Armatimonadota bacterium]MDI9585901.1 50S ribosomal protein L9 [Acidobacteriota bacterium]